MAQVLSLYKLHKIAANVSPLIHRSFGFDVDDTSSEFIQFSQIEADLSPLIHQALFIKPFWF